MKLGISYNVFDGEELLEGSLKLVRRYADYISIIYQTLSNLNRPCSPSLESSIFAIKKSGLVEELITYRPDFSLSPTENETIKRNIGLNMSRFSVCTHHLSMDVDEYYDPQEFANICKYIDDNDIDLSACGLYSYYKYPFLRLDPPERYFVTFITRIYENSNFITGSYFPVLVDPSRRMNDARCKGLMKFKCFSQDDLMMHHFTYVRKNLRSKLENSSASINFTNIEKVIQHYDNFRIGDQALFAGNPPAYHNLIRVNQHLL
jgi:hypothetical protein